MKLNVSILFRYFQPSLSSNARVVVPQATFPPTAVYFHDPQPEQPRVESELHVESDLTAQEPKDSPHSASARRVVASRLRDLPEYQCQMRQCPECAHVTYTVDESTQTERIGSQSSRSASRFDENFDRKLKRTARTETSTETPII